LILPSQGTVGAVCMDSWGNLAVATSTGGLTNKSPGRIGDTPTVGAGFWAESWVEKCTRETLLGHELVDALLTSLSISVKTVVGSCIPPLHAGRGSYVPLSSSSSQGWSRETSKSDYRRRAVALSGTGNGDSFLRVDAARTAAAMCRFRDRSISLSDAVKLVAGPGGELQQSAGDHWGKTGEGQGGIIGIEVHGSADVDHGRGGVPKICGSVVFDFNCGGLWRAWYDLDPETGQHMPRVMVFREEY